MGTSEEGYEPVLTDAERLHQQVTEIEKQRDAYRSQAEDLGLKLAEQQQINGQLRQSLADTTSYVLTLCRVIQRTIG